MRWSDKLSLRLRSLLKRRRVEHELNKELQFHMQQQIEENLASGMNEHDARLAALRMVGGLEQIREECRDERQIGFIDALFQDLRSAVRMLLRKPAFTIIAILTLALAIGANTAIFSIADAVLFRSLPYKDPDQVFIFQGLNRLTGQRYTSVPDSQFQVIDEHHSTLSRLGMISGGPGLIIQSGDGVESVRTAAVSPNYFDILGAQAARGRLFSSTAPDEPARSAVLAYETWQRRFGGDETVVGRTVTMGSRTFNVVGVLPRHFVFPSLMVGKPEVITVKPPASGKMAGVFHPIVRLDAGATRQQAQAEIDALIGPLTADDPKLANSGPVLDDVRSVLYPFGRAAMTFLLVAAIFVLLIGCAHLANMFMVQTKANEPEIGMRLALGASRLRLIRPLIFQASAISLGATIIAILVTFATFDLLLQQVPPAVYRNAPVGVNTRVLLFALSLSALASLAFSFLPVWRVSGMDALALIQRRTSNGGTRIGRPMVAVQVALAIVLVFGAVIAGRTFLSVLNVPLGFDPENIVSINVRPDGAKGLELQEFYAQAMEALASRSDVISVGAASSPPLGPYTADSVVKSEIATKIGVFYVLPGYFETVGIRLLRGRLIDKNDVRSGARVAVIDETAARALYSGRDPLGATIEVGRDRQFILVGVVADVRESLDRTDAPAAYVIPGEDIRGLTLFAKMRNRGDTALTDIRSQIALHAPGSPVTVEWWGDSISALTPYRNPRFQSLVLGTFAALALGLTALGTFSVVAFLVAIRTRELGIRAALGAPASSLSKLVITKMLTPVIAGLLIGLLTLWWTVRFVSSELYKLETNDPVTLVASVVTVLVAALLAAYVPARHASRVDPIVVLRQE